MATRSPKIRGSTVAINITNSSISNNGTAFRTPTSAEININDSTIVGNTVAFDVYLTPDAFVRAGLPPDTPPSLVKELIDSIQATGNKPTQESTVEALPSSSLGQWLEQKIGTAASLIAVGDAVWKIVSALSG
jgi:hypothetical protein